MLYLNKLINNKILIEEFYEYFSKYGEIEENSLIIDKEK